MIQGKSQSGQELETHTQKEAVVEYFWSLSLGPVSIQFGFVSIEAALFKEEGTPSQ